jgi:hypothetical protein
MKVPRALFCLLLCSRIVAAQAPSVALEAHTDALGFTYSLPIDWEVVQATPALPDVKTKAPDSAASDEDKKGVACAEIAFTARHGDPASVIVVVVLPFACFGQSMSAKDLPGFAQGAAEGIKQSFDITDLVNSDYKLGSHRMWAERAKGTPKGHPEASPYSVEITCTVLKKAAVCFMGMIASDDAAKAFESGPVTLEADSPAALVPQGAFEKKPAP